MSSDKKGSSSSKKLETVVVPSKSPSFKNLEAAQEAVAAGFVPQTFDLTLACMEGKWDIAYFLLSRGAKPNTDTLLNVAAGNECDLMIQMVVNGGGVLNHYHLVEAYQHKLNHEGLPDPNVAMTELIMNFGVLPLREDLIFAIRHQLHPIITLFMNGRGLIADNEHVCNACEVGDEVILTLLLNQERTIHIHENSIPWSSSGTALVSSSCSLTNTLCCCLSCLCGDGSGSTKTTSITYNAFSAAMNKYNSGTLIGLLDIYAVSERRHLNFYCGKYQGHVKSKGCCGCGCCLDPSKE